MSIFHTVYTLFETVIKLLYKSVVSNSLCIMFFAIIYIVINLNKPFNYGIPYKQKLQVIDKQFLFSVKNQFLYDVEVPYHISLGLNNLDIESFTILAQQVAVVVILVFYKLKFVLELHRKYHIKWI
jgi:hypothetical protein